MITYIKGSIAELTPTEVVVEAAGVGYSIAISLNTFAALQGKESARVYVTEVIREDAHLLFGFYSKQERTLFEGLRLASDRTIDTTGMNVHELARTVREMFAEGADKKLNLTVMSFGFKYGAPSDANYMADMRFIPNPHWVPELRPLTGQDAPVRDYVLEHAGTEEFISNYLAALRPVLEGYRREGKYYATIAIGCTGGKHRSVAVTEELARRLSAFGELNVNVQHRDKGRE